MQSLLSCLTAIVLSNYSLPQDVNDEVVYVEFTNRSNFQELAAIQAQ